MSSILSSMESYFMVPDENYFTKNGFACSDYGPKIKRKRKAYFKTMVVRVLSTAYYGSAAIELKIRYTIYKDNSAVLTICPKLSNDYLTSAYRIAFDTVTIKDPDISELQAAIENVVARFNRI
jgi:hypothetical protein